VSNTKKEWIDIYARCGLQISDGFESTIRFPKKKDTALGYEDVLKRHDRSVISSYDLVETDTELYITERANNLLLFTAFGAVIVTGFANVNRLRRWAKPISSHRFWPVIAQQVRDSAVNGNHE
jgi:hypothetical protein